MDSRSLSKRTVVIISLVLLYSVAWYMGKARAHYLSANNASLKPITLSTIHGDLTVEDPLIIELIQSPAMQRLKNIRQYGSNDYARSNKDSRLYTRYEHSIGVFYILHRHGAPRIEQVAGLLHDCSHTVFSHATEPLFRGDGLESYQDSIHEEFLKRYGVEDILVRYGITAEDVLPKNEHFKALEQSLPTLCADRLEYNFFAGVMDGFLTQEELKNLHEQLHFDGQHWYFDSVEAAKKFAEIPLYESVHRWQSPSGMLMNRWTSDALRQALAIGLIDSDDIHFSLTDDVMWQRLMHSDDPVIKECIHKIIYCDDYFSLSTAEDYDLVIPAKFRGVDPLVKTQLGLERLSELDAAFNAEFQRLKGVMQQGCYIKLHNPVVTSSQAIAATNS